MDVKLIEGIIKSERAKKVIESTEFYFQKGQNALKKWLDYEVEENFKTELVGLANNYDELQKRSEDNTNLKKILELLFEIVSYCDIQAKDKIFYNKYDDNRVLAKASVRMNNWIEKLILYKFDTEKVSRGSVLNAINYLLSPRTNSTILSESHRQQISNNLLGKEYDSMSFVKDLEEYFTGYEVNMINNENYTHLLSIIIYSIKKDWFDEVVGLMASDGTGWQDGHIKEMKGNNAVIIWNSKRPSGKNETLKYLRNIVDEGNTFNLYYSSRGKVNYKATVIDFVENQEQLDNKNWNEDQNILFYEDNFTYYNDGKKNAKIVFLVKTLEKIKPIEVSKFKIYKNYDYPTQDNITPLKFEPEDIDIEETQTKNNNTVKNTQHLNQILFGPPGTGKTYNSINRALEIIGEKIDGKTRKEIKDLFDIKLETGEIVFTTFHQSMSYEDFIEGIKPIEPKKEGLPVIYRVVDGIFKKICGKTFPFITGEMIGNYKVISLTSETITLQKPNGYHVSFTFKMLNGLIKYLKDNGVSIKDFSGKVETDKIDKSIYPELEPYIINGYENIIPSLLDRLSNTRHSNTPKVLIIDEINRGSVSNIFGELITLIEEDKRLGENEALEITLPYSKEKFGVPSNLYIIGTMNTADKSVEALDAALRRRFHFEEMPPRYDLECINYDYAGFKVSEILHTINMRIEKLLDKDHAIGHSYFILKDGETAEQRLRTSFSKCIIPLLQEYFYGDLGKIGLVLGKGFVRKKEWNEKDNSFANFEYDSISDFDERVLYEFVDYTGKESASNFNKTEDSKNMDWDFEKAINHLMN